MSNKKYINLHKAQKRKNDEFYTLYKDVENECSLYAEYYKDKIIYCNCDTTNSNFYKYFVNNFNKFHLKKVICSYYNPNGESYKTEYDGKTTTVVKLIGNGSFYNEESIEILKQSDVIVTNPPFSHFRGYIKQLLEYNKQFLIVGNLNAVAYKEIFPYIKSNKIQTGVNSIQQFLTPENTIKKFGNILWFTNINTNNTRRKFLKLNKVFNENEYPMYDNYKIINVDKLKDIPKNYYGVIGVPITLLTKYNPNQFEILDLRGYCNNNIINNLYVAESNLPKSDVYLNGKCLYKRVFVKLKHLDIIEIKSNKNKTKIWICRIS